MFTLRTISKEGLQQNTALGSEYLLADRFMSGGQAFRDAFKRVFDYDHVADLDPSATDATKNCIAIITADGVQIPVWDFKDNYIMTESGQTFARIR